MKKVKTLLSVLLVLVMSVSLMTAALADEIDTGDTGFRFTDVAEDSMYAEYIYDIYNRGITNGTSDTTFSPKATLNRAQFVTFIGRLAGVDASAYTENPFTDVTDTISWAKGYIIWAYELGITTGTSDTTFHPGNELTREQMATMMFRFADAYGIKLEFSPTVAADIDSCSTWATKAVKMFGGTSIDLDENGNFNPVVPATREQMAKVVSMFEVPEGGFVIPEPDVGGETGNVVTINGTDYELKASDKDVLTLKNNSGYEKVYAGKLFTKIYKEEIADDAVVTLVCADGYELEPITGAQLKTAIFVFYVDSEAVSDDLDGVSYVFRFAYMPADGSDTGSAAKFVTNIIISDGESEVVDGGVIVINGEEYVLPYVAEASMNLTNKKGVTVLYEGVEFVTIYADEIAEDAVVTVTCADGYNSTITGGQLRVALFAFAADGQPYEDDYEGTKFAFRFAFPEADGSLNGSPSKYVTEITIA